MSALTPHLTPPFFDVVPSFFKMRHELGFFLFVKGNLFRNAPVRPVTLAGEDVHTRPQIISLKPVVGVNDGVSVLPFVTVWFIDFPQAASAAFCRIWSGPPFVNISKIQTFFDQGGLRVLIQSYTTLMTALFPFLRSLFVFRPFSVIGIPSFQIAPNPNSIIPIIKTFLRNATIGLSAKGKKTKEKNNG